MVEGMMKRVQFRKLHSLNVVSMHVIQNHKCSCDNPHLYVMCYYNRPTYGIETIPACEGCYGGYFGKSLNIERAIDKYSIDIMFLIKRLKNVPKDILFYIGKKYYKQIPTIYNESGIALFNTICERARSAIRTFCLYCIRYQKGRVNRDLRRKISELLWNDKIQWLKE